MSPCSGHATWRSVRARGVGTVLRQDARAVGGGAWRGLTIWVHEGASDCVHLDPPVFVVLAMCAAALRLTATVAGIDHSVSRHEFRLKFDQDKAKAISRIRGRGAEQLAAFEDQNVTPALDVTVSFRFGWCVSIVILHLSLLVDVLIVAHSDIFYVCGWCAVWSGVCAEGLCSIFWCNTTHVLRAESMVMRSKYFVGIRRSMRSVQRSFVLPPACTLGPWRFRAGPVNGQRDVFFVAH